MGTLRHLSWRSHVLLIEKVSKLHLNMSEGEEPRFSTEETPFRTAPFDTRFPNQNQEKACWQGFVDFHRCKKIKGDDYEPCNYFRKVANSLCPKEYVEKWDEQMENGNFVEKI